MIDEGYVTKDERGVKDLREAISRKRQLTGSIREIGDDLILLGNWINEFAEGESDTKPGRELIEWAAQKYGTLFSERPESD